MHKADMLHRVDELPRLGDHAALHRVRPELERLFELLKDINDLLDVDRAVGLARGCVTQLTDTGVTGAGIVPPIAALIGQFVGRFEHLNLQRGVEALEQRTEVGRHDAAADQTDVGGGDERDGVHGWNAGMIPPKPSPVCGVSRPRTSSACQQWSEMGTRSARRRAASVSTPRAA